MHPPAFERMAADMAVPMPNRESEEEVFDFESLRT